MNSGNVPRALRWIPSTSLIKHAFEGLVDNEFPGLHFEPASPDGTGDVRAGEQAGPWVSPPPLCQRGTETLACMHACPRCDRQSNDVFTCPAADSLECDACKRNA